MQRLADSYGSVLTCKYDSSTERTIYWGTGLKISKLLVSQRLSRVAIRLRQTKQSHDAMSSRSSLVGNRMLDWHATNQFGVQPRHGLVDLSPPEKSCTKSLCVSPVFLLQLRRGVVTTLSCSTCMLKTRAMPSPLIWGDSHAYMRHFRPNHVSLQVSDRLKYGLKNLGSTKSPRPRKSLT